MATKPLIKESLALLDFCGLNPINQNTRTNLQVTLIFVSLFHLTVELALQLLFNWTDLESVDGITSLGMIYQVISRMLVMLVYRRTLGNLLRKIDSFWPLDRYHIQNEIENILNKMRAYSKIFTVMFYSCGMLYLVKPCFTVNKTLPYLTYHPRDLHKSPEYELIYTHQIIEMIFGSSTILSFDGFFVFLIMYIVCEIKKLKQGFVSLATEDADETRSLIKIKRLVNHHNLILGCIKDMSKVYSLMLLNQFLSSLICMCAGLLSMIGNGIPPDLQHFTKYTFFIGTILSQLFLYCQAGSYLISENESISQAVYNSDWWIKTQPEIRRACSLVIQRANKREQLTAGGMFVLNLESFTTVVRMSLSFFTLVQAVYSRNRNS